MSFITIYFSGSRPNSGFYIAFIFTSLQNLSGTIPQPFSFFDFHAMITFEKSRPAVLQNITQLTLNSFNDLAKNTTQVMLCLAQYIISRRTMSVCFIRPTLVPYSGEMWQFDQ